MIISNAQTLKSLFSTNLPISSPVHTTVCNAAGFPHRASAASLCHRKALVGRSLQLESLHCWAGEAAIVGQFRAEERQGERWHLLCNLETTLYLADLVMNFNTSWGTRVSLGHQWWLGLCLLLRRERVGLAMNSPTPRTPLPSLLAGEQGPWGNFKWTLWWSCEPWVSQWLCLMQFVERVKDEKHTLLVPSCAMLFRAIDGCPTISNKTCEFQWWDMALLGE